MKYKIALPRLVANSLRLSSDPSRQSATPSHSQSFWMQNCLSSHNTLPSSQYTSSWSTTLAFVVVVAVAVVVVDVVVDVVDVVVALVGVVVSAAGVEAIVTLVAALVELEDVTAVVGVVVGTEDVEEDVVVVDDAGVVDGLADGSLGSESELLAEVTVVEELPSP